MNNRIGLTSVEAAQKLKSNGPNEIASHRSTFLDSLLGVLKEPMVLLLIACSLLYFFVGESTDAWFLMASVAFIGGISFFQEYKTEKSLAALKKLSSPRAYVRRDGQTMRIAGRDLVVGDLLLLREGDRVAADAQVLQAVNLLVDESLLTGESVAVSKLQPSERLTDSPEESAQVFSGSLIVRGGGEALVTAIGLSTRIGHISGLLRDIKEFPSPLQLQARKLAKQMGVIALIVCLLAILLYGILKGQWTTAILSGLTLAVALMPEELPLIMTVFFALGAWRMAKQNLLTRRISAIESLGSVQVLCTDKTGTLTMNRMEVAKTWVRDSSHTEEELLRIFVDASEKDSLDPMERAVVNRVGPAVSGALVRAFGLSSKFLAVTHVRESSGLSISSKGAVETILSICRMDEQDRLEIVERADLWASEGIRILAVARLLNAEQIPDDPNELRLDFIGLVGFADPVRDGVKEAVAQCQSAGIRLVMITGDYPATALAIAKSIGLVASTETKVLSGARLQEMSDSTLKKEILATQVFARIKPEQKLQLVKAYQSLEQNVAMTGDGVNDGPSLKAADVGIAMGRRGTDVAREASDLVLLDDDFSSIVESIRLGRGIFDNLRRATEFIIAVHVPIALVALFQALFNVPMLFFPLHVVLLELVIDPACTLVFEAEAPHAGVMKRQPRPTHEPIVQKVQMAASAIHGAFIFLATLIVIFVAHRLDHTESQLRTAVFSVVVMGFVGVIFGKLTRQRSVWKAPRNPWLFLVLCVPIFTLVGASLIPSVRGVLKFAYIPVAELALMLLLGWASGFLPARYFNKSET